MIDYSLLVGIHRASVSRSVLRSRDSSRFYKLASCDRSRDCGSERGGEFSGSPAIAALLDEAVHQRKASVQMFEAVSQQQVHHKSQECNHSNLQASVKFESLSCHPEEPEVGKEIYFVGCIDILCE